MKKYILLLTISPALITGLLAISQPTDAQVNSLPVKGNKFIFGIDGGLALPGSDYGSSSVSLLANPSNSSIDGFAKMGYCYDAYIGFKFSKFIGIMVQNGTSNNSYNATGLNNQDRTATVSGGYIVNEYLTGPYLSITVKKIKIEVKLMGGIVSSNYPSTTFIYSGLLNPYGESVVNSFLNGSGFGYCAGAKIKYMMLGGALGIGFGLNYTGSNIKYSDFTVTVNGSSTVEAPV